MIWYNGLTTLVEMLGKVTLTFPHLRENQNTGEGHPAMTGQDQNLRWGQESQGTKWADSASGSSCDLYILCLWSSFPKFAFLGVSSAWKIFLHFFMSRCSEKEKELSENHHDRMLVST